MTKKTARQRKKRQGAVSKKKQHAEGNANKQSETENGAAESDYGVSNQVRKGLIQAHNLRRELDALLTADLARLPDVQELISHHFHSLEELQELVVLQMSVPKSMCMTLISSISSLPIFDQLVISKLDTLPDWKEAMETRSGRRLSDLLPESLAHVLADLEDWAENLCLPEAIAERLASYKEVKSAVIESITTSTTLTSPIQRIISNNLHQLPDVKSLVMKNLENLPHLQECLHDHYIRSTPKLKDFMHLPEYLQDNEYVMSGYRPEMLTFKRCLKSMLYVHNETVNIYSHLFAGLAFLVLSFYAHWWILDDRPWGDWHALNGFFLGAICCLMMSAAFHLFHAIDCDNCLFWSRVDYAGIGGLISGSVAAVVYFMFYCQPALQITYISLTMFFGVLATGMSFSDSCRSPNLKWVRAAIFIALATTAVLPLTHYTLQYGMFAIFHVLDMFWLLISVASYLVGVCLYVSKFPESRFPGKFDIWFHSHQLWHFCVITGALTHYIATFNMLHYREDKHCAFEQSLGLFD